MLKMLFPHYFHSTRSNTAAQHSMWPRIYTCMYCLPQFVFWWGFKALTVGLNFSSYSSKMNSSDLDYGPWRLPIEQKNINPTHQSPFLVRQTNFSHPDCWFNTQGWQENWQGFQAGSRAVLILPIFYFHAEVKSSSWVHWNDSEENILVISLWDWRSCLGGRGPCLIWNIAQKLHSWSKNYNLKINLIIRVHLINVFFSLFPLFSTSSLQVPQVPNVFPETFNSTSVYIPCCLAAVHLPCTYIMAITRSL